MRQKYKKMIDVMLEKEAVSLRNKADGVEDPWYLYILRCNDGSLYTGITKDLEKRFKMHNDGKASRYTRTKRPVVLAYHEVCPSHAQALARECSIKEFSRHKKEQLIRSQP